MLKWRRESVLDLYNLLLAVFLFVSTWLLGFTSNAAKADLWMDSAVIAAISIAAMIAYANWEEWANFVLGIWLVISPFVLGFTRTSAMHFSIGIGVAIAFLAMLELWLVYDDYKPPQAPPAASGQH
jgi:SPW repeat